MGQTGTQPRSNLMLVLGAWFDALASGDVQRLRSLLAEDIAWEGHHPGQICHGPDQALHFLGTGLDTMRGITNLIATESGDKVIAVADGPDFVDFTDGEETVPRARAGIEFTVSDGRIVHMRGLTDAECSAVVSKRSFES